MPIIGIDKERLESAAGVEFNYNDVNEFVELLTIYANRFQEPSSSSVPVWMQADWEGFHQPRRAELEARRALIEALEGVWRARGGKGVGSYYSDASDDYEGPLLKLLEELFHAVDGVNSPSPSTLHHDLKFIATGRERHRSRDK